jgi:hypothetical protein
MNQPQPSAEAEEQATTKRAKLLLWCVVLGLIILNAALIMVALRFVSPQPNAPGEGAPSASPTNTSTVTQP